MTQIDLQDLKQRLDTLQEIEADLGPGRRSGRWVMFSCPFPGHKRGDANPSLTVTPDNGQWHCFTCGRSGDLITWLQDYRGMTWREIFELTGSDALPEPKPRPPAAPRLQPSAPPAEAWQVKAGMFVDDCERCLWSAEGVKALEYLHGRGLNDDTIKFYRLGFNPKDYYDPRELWGLPEHPEGKGVWLPKSIVIPCFDGPDLWYVNMRRPAGDPKYYKIPGSKAAVFGVYHLLGAELVLLVEGEFDCMLANQYIRDVCGVATLGAASKKFDVSTWGRYFMPARVILAALDADQAGAAGADQLRQLSAQIHIIGIPRLNPGDKDITDYVKAGGDLWEWLKYHLEQLGVLETLGV